MLNWFDSNKISKNKLNRYPKISYEEHLNLHKILESKINLKSGTRENCSIAGIKDSESTY